MGESEDIKKYRKDKSLELIEKYKDLIQKTFEVADKDLLQTKIDTDSEEENEQKLLTAIKSRRVSLDEVDLMLDKIEKLENNIKEVDGSEEETPIKQSFVKRKAQK